MNNKWQSAHQEHIASRARTLLDRGYFSDVDVTVQGTAFPCHRYVLAQSSHLFFSQLTEPRTPAFQQSAASRPTTSHTALRPKADSDDGLSVSGADGTYPPRGDVDSVRLQQEKLLESLGKPAQTAGLPLLKAQSDQASQKSFGNTDTAPAEDCVVQTSTNFREGLHALYSDTSPKIKPDLFTSPPPQQRQDQSVLSQKTGGGEQSQERPVLKLNFLSPETFSAILGAIYCGQDTVTAANAVDVFKAATRLEITSLVRHSEQLIVQLIRHGSIDASWILYSAPMAQSPAILQGALEVLLTDFGPDTSRADWFLKLPAEQLFTVLTDPRLNVRHEDEVYRALTDWYRHDPCSRERYMATALTLVRLANVNKRILVEEILPHPALCAGRHPVSEEGGRGRGSGEGTDDVSLARLVGQALAYHLLPDRRHDELLAVADFRPSQDWERVLLVLGDQSDQLYAFSFARRAWFRLAPPPKALGLGVAACTHGDDLYVSGGDKAMRGCYRFRAVGNTWTQLGDLKQGRRSHGCVAVGDWLYVLGGKDDRQSFKKDTLDSVEMLHVKDKGQGWRLVTTGALVVPVRSMTCVVHAENIYIMGGRTNGLQQTVDALQCFDTRTGQCSLVGRLPSPSCLSRSFTSGRVTFLLQPNGDLLRFHPTLLHHQGTLSSKALQSQHPSQAQSRVVDSSYSPASEKQQQQQQQQSLQGSEGEQNGAFTHVGKSGKPGLEVVRGGAWSRGDAVRSCWGMPSWFPCRWVRCWWWWWWWWWWRWRWYRSVW
ncbi:ectoderm-neural cortex protein 1-like [Babylonia areolata]|uniref:ectoderm-neural cortex protein 1-like n=1 Tax=Babylonia areolata TaxID=304850 RepID=UPI003FCF77CB